VPDAFEWAQSALSVDRYTVKYLDKAGIRNVLSGGSGRKIYMDPAKLKAWFAQKSTKGFRALVKDYTDMAKGSVHVPPDAPDAAKRVVQHLVLWGIRARHVQDAQEFKARFGSKVWDRVNLDAVTEYVWAEFGRLLYMNETMNIMRYKLRGSRQEPFLLTPSAYATGGQQGYARNRFITSPNGQATGLSLPRGARFVVVVPGGNCAAVKFAESLK
jgi:hypothetical protein